MLQAETCRVDTDSSCCWVKIHCWHINLEKEHTAACNQRWCHYQSIFTCFHSTHSVSTTSLSCFINHSASQSCSPFNFVDFSIVVKLLWLKLYMSCRFLTFEAYRMFRGYSLSHSWQAFNVKHLSDSSKNKIKNDKVEAIGIKYWLQTVFHVRHYSTHVSTPPPMSIYDWKLQQLLSGAGVFLQSHVNWANSICRGRSYETTESSRTS